MLLHQSPLAEDLRRAGAVPVDHRGPCIAAHYGSAAAELAVCSTAVGLADRSDLAVLELRGRAGALARLTRERTGRALAPGDVAAAGGAVWSARSPTRVLVVGELDPPLAPAAPVAVVDRSVELLALELLGPATGRVLAALGEPALERLGAQLLRCSPAHVLALAPRARARELWLAVRRAGQSYGLSCVGTEAVRRFSLLERAGRPL
jgi:glycine cleavage system aminomethyltransferase T